MVVLLAFIGYFFFGAASVFRGNLTRWNTYIYRHVLRWLHDGDDDDMFYPASQTKSILSIGPPSMPHFSCLLGCIATQMLTLFPNYSSFQLL
ncbi:hypothetical protein F4810DRAFT_658164 [Camillea tinctor]|nr:hypothetical protein F4810DRAFT_658164 [Camillea tinctor]